MSMTLASLVSCSASVEPVIRISSMYTDTPSWSRSRSLIMRWKISGADVMPKGNRLKQKRPYGVMNVVSFWLCSSNGMAQKPLAASNEEKNLAPANFGIISSIVGSTNFSRITALLRRFKSTQIRTVPFFFGTGTIGAHHSVASCTGIITSFLTMRSNSAFTCFNRGSEIRLAQLILYGSASLCNRMLTGAHCISPISP